VRDRRGRRLATPFIDAVFAGFGVPTITALAVLAIDDHSTPVLLQGVLMGAPLSMQPLERGFAAAPRVRPSPASEMATSGLLR
jgi:hypothetical protein